MHSDPGSNVTYVNSPRENDINVTAPPIDFNLLLQSGPLYLNTNDRIATIFMMIVLLIIGITGNFLVLVFIIRDSRLHTPILTAVACHAFADFMIVGIWFGQALYTISVGNTDHFNNYKIACILERTLKVPWALGQTQNLSVMASERFLYFKYPYLYTRFISVKKVLTAEILVYVASLVFVVVNNSSQGSSSYYSVSLFHCSLYNNPLYFAMTIAIWIAPPALVVIFMVVTLTLMILKQRRQIHAQQMDVQRAAHERRPEQASAPSDYRANQATPVRNCDGNVGSVSTQTDVGQSDQRVHDEDGPDTNDATENSGPARMVEIGVCINNPTVTSDLGQCWSSAGEQMRLEYDNEQRSQHFTQFSQIDAGCDEPPSLDSSPGPRWTSDQQQVKRQFVWSMTRNEYREGPLVNEDSKSSAGVQWKELAGSRSGLAQNDGESDEFRGRHYQGYVYGRSGSTRELQDSRVAEIIHESKSMPDLVTLSASNYNLNGADTSSQNKVADKPQQTTSQNTTDRNQHPSSQNTTDSDQHPSSHTPSQNTTDTYQYSSASNNLIKTMMTAIKLVGCISLSFYLTYIPCGVVTFKVYSVVSILDIELGRAPSYYYLMRIFYFFGLSLSAVINPFFQFYFNQPLMRALYKALRINKRKLEWNSHAATISIVE